VKDLAARTSTSVISIAGRAHQFVRSGSMRERLIEHPRLFIDALSARHQQHDAERLGAGPEGAALAQLRALDARLRQARKHLAPLTAPIPAPLASACLALRTQWQALHTEITRLVDDDAQRN